MRCHVCEQTDEVVKCAHPSCRNYICPRHAMRYEISDETGMYVESFCSRACYIQTVRRAMPAQQELLIALIVVLVAAVFYVVLLRAATINL